MIRNSFRRVFDLMVYSSDFGMFVFIIGFVVVKLDLIFKLERRVAFWIKDFDGLKSGKGRFSGEFRFIEF